MYILLLGRRDTKHPQRYATAMGRKNHISAGNFEKSQTSTIIDAYLHLLLPYFLATLYCTDTYMQDRPFMWY